MTASRRLPALLVFLITLALYLPHLDHPFLNWDDPQNLLENPHFRSWSWSDLKWMLTRFHLGVYQPLSWLSWSVDYRIWGLDPFGYHLTNLLLHCANAVLLYYLALSLLRIFNSVGTEGDRFEATLARRPGASGACEERSRPPCESSSMGVGGSEATKQATRSYPGRAPGAEDRFPSEPSEPLRVKTAAAFAALAFSLHPMLVSSVVWASNRSYPLAGLFCSGSILAYLKAQESSPRKWNRRGWILLSLFSFACSLQAKAIGMTLPLALLLLDIHLKQLAADPRRWFRPEGIRIWKEKIPFLLLAAAATAVALWAKTAKTGGIPMLQTYGLPPRLAKASYGILFYPLHTLWPIGLHAVHQGPFLQRPLASPFPACGSAVLLLTCLLWCVRRRFPSLWIGWMAYLALALPFLGLAHYEAHLAADRYAYIAGTVWALLAGGIWLAMRPAPPLKVFVGILALWSSLSWLQCLKWKDSTLLWQHTLRWNPTCEIAHNNWATMANQGGRNAEALHRYDHALRVKPTYALALYNRGNAYRDLGLPDRALADYTASIRFDPRYVPGYINRASLAIDRLHTYEAALWDCERALELDPGEPVARFNLALSLHKLGRSGEALPHLERLLASNPDYADARRLLDEVRKGKPIKASVPP
jgi:tetratricopeptide (TPR) repeat protein